MNWTKWIIASLIGGLAYFFSGWLVYGILFNEVFTGNELRATGAYGDQDFKISFMIISCLAMGSFIAFIFVRWAGITDIISGAINGAIIAAFMSLVAGLALAAEYKIFSADLALYDMVANGLCAAIPGGLIGLYLGKSAD